MLRIDPDTEADRARLALESHLSRAKWMTEQGYRHLLRSGLEAAGNSARTLRLIIN